MAGHVEVGDQAFISGGVVIHQYSKIGRLAMIGGNSRVNLDVPPFFLYTDFNVRPNGLNLVGLKRAGLSREEIAALKAAYKILYRSGSEIERRAGADCVGAGHRAHAATGEVYREQRAGNLPGMTAAALLKDIRARLKAAADPEFEAGLRWFFKEPVKPYGVRTPLLRELARLAYAQVKHWPVAERDRFVTELWKSGMLEEGVVVTHLYRRFAKSCGEREFRMFEQWVDRYVTNWSNCDGVSTWLIAACIANRPGLADRLAGWTKSKNRWKRRSAAVSLIQEAKQGRNTETIFHICGLLLEDADDMVQKGVGWVLKETYPKRPRRGFGFSG